MLEGIYDMLVEQGVKIEEMDSKLATLTTHSPEKKGIKGLAEILGSSKTTAMKWMKTGKIPYKRIGNIYLFDVEEVRNAIKKLK
jgi:excisionase family DNA binding protein